MSLISKKKINFISDNCQYVDNIIKILFSKNFKFQNFIKNKKYNIQFICLQ